MNPRSTDWKTFDEVDSTQNVASEMLLAGENVGVVIARHQTAGKGRFDRKWHSAPGEVLAMSLVFEEHPRPYLLGMACALATAEALDCQIQWPNDVVVGGKKVAGVLTEIKQDTRSRRLPVVGIGVNLNQLEFPQEIAHRAWSLRLRDDEVRDPFEIAKAIVEQIHRIPTPSRWTELHDLWMRHDVTPGKEYQLNDGRVGIATSVGMDGELVCMIDGQSQTVYAADAIFGNSQ